MEQGAQLPPDGEPTGALRPQAPAQAPPWQQQPSPFAWGLQHSGLASLPPGTPAEGSLPQSAAPEPAGQPPSAAAPALPQPVLQPAEPAARASPSEPPAQPALSLLDPQPPAAAAAEGGSPGASWPRALAPPSARQPPWLQEGEGLWSLLLTSHNFPARLGLPRSGPGAGHQGSQSSHLALRKTCTDVLNTNGCPTNPAGTLRQFVSTAAWYWRR